MRIRKPHVLKSKFTNRILILFVYPEGHMKHFDENSQKILFLNPFQNKNALFWL